MNYDFTLSIGDLELDINGDYTGHEIQTHDSPSFSSEFDVLEVQLNGVDILDVLSAEVLVQISEECIIKVEN